MAKNPVDDFLEVKKTAQEEKKQKELTQLSLWKQTKDPEHLQPLLKAYEPVINYGMRTYRAPTVPEEAMRTELMKHVVNAFDTYDPNKGTALGTHVQNRLRKASRYNTKYQNVGYIPEEQKGNIAPVQAARNQLSSDLGREPTHEEIAQYTNLTPKTVGRVIKSTRRDIPASALETDPTAFQANVNEEIMSLLPHSLSPQERPVFDYLYGEKKQEHPGSMGALAKKLNMNPSQLSRIHTSIQKKYNQYK